MSLVKRETGLIMVKPHAVEHGLDYVVEDILNGGVSTNLLPEKDPLLGLLPDITVEQAVIRNLDNVPYGRHLIEVFYADKATRRYYPLIREQYIGRVVFVPFVYNGNIPLQQVYESLKGNAHAVDTSGNLYSSPQGIRGALGANYTYVSKEDSEMLDDEAYREMFTPVVNNYIHVCDSALQMREAQKHITIAS